MANTVYPFEEILQFEGANSQPPRRALACVRCHAQKLRCVRLLYIPRGGAWTARCREVRLMRHSQRCAPTRARRAIAVYLPTPIASHAGPSDWAGRARRTRRLRRAMHSPVVNNNEPRGLVGRARTAAAP